MIEAGALLLADNVSVFYLYLVEGIFLSFYLVTMGFGSDSMNFPNGSINCNITLPKPTRALPLILFRVSVV